MISRSLKIRKSCRWDKYEDRGYVFVFVFVFFLFIWDELRLFQEDHRISKGELVLLNACNRKFLNTLRWRPGAGCLPQDNSSRNWETEVKIHTCPLCVCVCVCVCESLSCVRLFGTPWATAHQAPLSMELSRQEPPSGNLPDPGIEPKSPALEGRFFAISATGEAPKVKVSVVQSCPTLCDLCYVFLSIIHIYTYICVNIKMSIGIYRVF